MIKGFHQPTLQKAEGSAKSGSDKDIIASIRAVRDSGKWGAGKPKKTQKTAISAKKIGGAKKQTPAKQRLTFRKKQYTLLEEKPNKREVEKFKNACENACYFLRVQKPKQKGDTYKVYGRKKK